jgi:hypothetical protein
MQVTIDEKKKQITIVADLQTPQPSKSGKTLVIASTRGNLKTSAQFQGKNVTVGLNVYIGKD